MLDPGFTCAGDPDCLKAINLVQLAAQYLLYCKQVNLDKLHFTQAQHVQMAKHLHRLKRVAKTQNQQIHALRKEVHDLELAQAVLVDVGESRRPDL